MQIDKLGIEIIGNNYSDFNELVKICQMYLPFYLYLLELLKNIVAHHPTGK